MDARTTNPNPPLALPWQLGPWLRRAYGANGLRTSQDRLVLVFADNSPVAFAVMRMLATHAQRLVVVVPPEMLGQGCFDTLRRSRPNIALLTAVPGEAGQVRECFDRALSMRGAIDAVVNLRCINTESVTLRTATLLAAHHHARAVAGNALECLQSTTGGILVDASVYNERVTAFALQWLQVISHELRDLFQLTESGAPALASLNCVLPHCRWPRCATRARAARDLVRTVETDLRTAWDSAAAISGIA